MLWLCIICFSFHRVCFFYLSPFGFLNLSSSVGQQSYKGLSLPRVSSFVLQLKKETKSLEKFIIIKLSIKFLQVTLLFCILNLPRGSVASSVTQVGALKILSFRVKSVSKFSSKCGVKSCLHLVRRNKDVALVSVTLRPTSKKSVFLCILVHVAAAHCWTQ